MASAFDPLHRTSGGGAWMLWMIAKATVASLAVAAIVKWWGGVGATVPDNVNVVLNFLSLFVLVGGLWFAPQALKAKAQEAIIAERDKIIAGHKQLLELREEEAEAAREKLTELGGALDEARSEAAAAQARYEEQNRYTAGPALEAIQKLLEHNDREAERRHTELLLALRAFASKRVTVQPPEPPGAHAGA